jgi:hypothetical protein
MLETDAVEYIFYEQKGLPVAEDKKRTRNEKGPE